MPPGKKTHRSNNKSDGWQPIVGQNTFFWMRPTDPAGARRWFPADGIGCLPLWLVVSSSAHMFTHNDYHNMMPRQSLGRMHPIMSKLDVPDILLSVIATFAMG